MAKNKVKSALKASFTYSHVHNFPGVLAEAYVNLKSDSPIQESIVNLQEPLKNGQLVDKYFAFCPVRDDGQVKKIHDPSGLTNNVTLLIAYIKISRNLGRNPFGKQKVYKNNKEVKGQVRDPVIYFDYAFETDEEPEDLPP